MKKAYRKRKKRKLFTLLEIIVAFFIFSMGVIVLLSQFSSASLRLIENRNVWKQNHEIINAAEYSLLVRPSDPLDSRFFDPDYLIVRKYVEPDLKTGYENPTIGLQLMTLQISLLRRSDREEVDFIQIDCWRDSNSGDPVNGN